VAASIQMIFELTRLDAAFEIYPNRDAFCALLERGEESVRLIA
jgi:hypothetical protein